MFYRVWLWIGHEEVNKPIIRYQPSSRIPWFRRRYSAVASVMGRRATQHMNDVNLMWKFGLLTRKTDAKKLETAHHRWIRNILGRWRMRTYDHFPEERSWKISDNVIWGGQHNTRISSTDWNTWRPENMVLVTPRCTKSRRDTHRLAQTTKQDMKRVDTVGETWRLSSTTEKLKMTVIIMWIIWF